jgi:cytidylate kinase
MMPKNLSLSITEALLRAQSKEEKARAQYAERPNYRISISREVGALGETVAREVGRRLGCPVYDREIVEKIAEELRQPASALQQLDERPVHWVEDWVRGLTLGQPLVSPDAYLHYLIATIRGMAEVGRCVIVGRGSTWILPPQSTLRVRLVADLPDRIKAVEKRRNLSEREAAAWLRGTETERTEFLRKHFGIDPADPHHYDVVLNSSRLSVTESADVIVQTFLCLEARAGTHAS